MRIVLGRGAFRRNFAIAPNQREQAAEDVKTIVLRGGKLPLYVLKGE